MPRDARYKLTALEASLGAIEADIERSRARNVMVDQHEPDSGPGVATPGRRVSAARRGIGAGAAPRRVGACHATAGTRNHDAAGVGGGSKSLSACVAASSPSPGGSGGRAGGSRGGAGRPGRARGDCARGRDVDAAGPSWPPSATDSVISSVGSFAALLTPISPGATTRASSSFV